MPDRVSLSASLAAGLGIAGIPLAMLGPLAAYAEWLRPMTGFYLFALGLLLGILALVLGVVGLLRTRSTSGRVGRSRAWLGTAAGFALVAVFLVTSGRGRGLPRINDITTSPGDPPLFRAALDDPANQGRDLSYPRSSFAQPQRAAYPDLTSIELAVPVGDAFERARRAAQALQWRITAENAEAGILEAVDVSRVFRFVDDVVVRVRPAPRGALVDVRSKSRDGRGDLGANADRIRAFRAEILGEADSRTSVTP